MRAVIRRGGAHDKLVVDGATFDLSSLTRSQRFTLNRWFVNAWATARGFAEPYPGYAVRDLAAGS